MQFVRFSARTTLVGLFTATLCYSAPAIAMGHARGGQEIAVRSDYTPFSIYGRTLKDMFQQLAELMGVKAGAGAFDWQSVWRQAEETRRRTDAATKEQIEKLQREIMEEAKRMGTQIGSAVPTTAVPTTAAPTSTAPSALPTPLVVDPALQSDLDEWIGAFDNPNDHNPDDYTYLIHVISGSPAEVAPFLAGDAATSASIITSANSAVVPHGTAGFILSPGQIEVASPNDLAIDNNAMRELTEEMRRKHYETMRDGRLLTPQEVIDQTPPGQHNEVVISSSPSGQTTVVGVFVLVYTPPNGPPQVLVTPEELAELQAFAQEHNIPLIQIPYTDPQN